MHLTSDKMCAIIVLPLTRDFFVLALFWDGRTPFLVIEGGIQRV